MASAKYWATENFYHLGYSILVACHPSQGLEMNGHNIDTACVGSHASPDQKVDQLCCVVGNIDRINMIRLHLKLRYPLLPLNVGTIKKELQSGH